MVNHIGRDVDIEVGGVAYTLSRFDRNIQKKFVEYANKVLPNPVLAIQPILDKLTPAQQQILLLDAGHQLRSGYNIGSQEVQALLGTADGLTHVLGLLLRKHHPHVTDEQAGAIFDDCQLEHGEAYLADKLNIAAGQVSRTVGEVQDDYLRSKGLLPEAEKKG